MSENVDISFKVRHPRNEWSSACWDFVPYITEILGRPPNMADGKNAAKPRLSRSLADYIERQQKDAAEYERSTPEQKEQKQLPQIPSVPSPDQELVAFLLWELGRELCFPEIDVKNTHAAPQQSARRQMQPDEMLLGSDGAKLADFAMGGFNANLAISQEFKRVIPEPGTPNWGRINYPDPWIGIDAARMLRFITLSTTGHFRATKVTHHKQLKSLGMQASFLANKITQHGPSQGDIGAFPQPYYLIEIFPSASLHSNISAIREFLEREVLKDFVRDNGGRKDTELKLLDLARFRLWVEYGNPGARKRLKEELPQKRWSIWNQLLFADAWDSAIERHLRLMRNLFPLHCYPQEILSQIPVALQRKAEKPRRVRQAMKSKGTKGNGSPRSPG